MEFIFNLLRYETFRFVVRMEGNPKYVIAKHRINLGMFPEVIAIEIESNYLLVTTDKNRRVVVDTDTPHFLHVINVGYQRNIV